MIKQDYLIRMIQEIISLIVNAILNKKKFRKDEWTEYDCLTRQILGVSQEELLSMSLDEMIDCYEGDPNRMGKIELKRYCFLSEHILARKAHPDVIWTFAKYQIPPRPKLSTKSRPPILSSPFY